MDQKNPINILENDAELQEYIVETDEEQNEHHDGLWQLPDFTAGTDMLVDFQIDALKKRPAQPEFSDIVSNKRKLINTVQQTKKNPATQRMMETGAAIAAQGAAMLQTISSSRKWTKSHVELRSATREFGVPRANSPSRSRSRHRVFDYNEDHDHHDP